MQAPAARLNEHHNALAPDGGLGGRARGVAVLDGGLAGTSPPLRRHINPFGHYHFNLERMRLPQTTGRD